MRWAASNLDSDEAKARNAAITGTDTKAALDAVRLVKAKYDEANRGFKAIVGTMPSNAAPVPRNYDEFKALKQRAESGDAAAVKTLRENWDTLSKKVF
jgi:hypothetical protein